MELSQQDKDLLAWSMEYCRRHNCEARGCIEMSYNNSFRMRDKALEDIQQATDKQMAITIYNSGKRGYFTTNRLNKNELKDFLDKAIESTGYLMADHCYSLPDPKRFYTGDGLGLDVLDPNFFSFTIEHKLDILKNMQEEMYGKDQRFISGTSEYVDNYIDSYMLSSNGFEGSRTSSTYSLSAVASVQGEGDVKPMDFACEGAAHYSDFPKDGVGTRALERALQKIGQRKVSSRTCPMLIPSRLSMQLLQPLLSAIMGNALYTKQSFLIDAVQKPLFSPLLTLRDMPHVPRSTSSAYFDHEGVAYQEGEVFIEGVLQTYYLDTYYSRKLDLLPTTSSPCQLRMPLGTTDELGLCKQMHNGIIVTDFNGGNCNPTTGDFSYGIEGFLIENGQKTQPINEMNITGNMLSLWKDLIAVGNDPSTPLTWHIPSLLFENVSFNGN